jgi:hypothetical protein
MPDEKHGWWEILDLHVVGSDWYDGECTRIYISSSSPALYTAHKLPALWELHPEIHAMMTSMRGTGVNNYGERFEVPEPHVYHRRNGDNDDLIQQPYLITFCTSRLVRWAGPPKPVREGAQDAAAV